LRIVNAEKRRAKESGVVGLVASWDTSVPLLEMTVNVAT